MNAKSTSRNILIKTIPLVLLENISSIISNNLKIKILTFYEIVMEFFN